jgi:hypothetical protein
MHLNQEFAGQVGGKWCSNRVMNSSSVLLCFVFAAIGYVIHPMILPSLVDSKLVAESSLSDSYRGDKVKKTDKNLPGSEDDEYEDTTKEYVAPKPIKPVVVEQPTPTKPTPTVPAIVTPKPDPKPYPKPEPEEPKVKPVVKLSDLELTNILKASVKAGDVNEFEFKQVLFWKRAGEEQLDGEIYHVGMVTYKADTIFDEQELDAKALIKDGKVVKWLWPTTNTKMR